MKILAYFLACLLILSNTTDAEAKMVKEIYTNVESEIANYYEAGGEWQLTNIDRMQFMNSENEEFILVSAQTRIRNLNSGKKTKESCLLSFAQDDTSFHSINCF